jgi:hypothetical protein
MSIKTILGTLAIMAALTSGSSVSQASDTCTKVKFKVTNHHQDKVTIKLLKLEFYNSDSGKWKTEDLVNQECGYGKTCTTSGDNLADAEGRNITKVKFHFQYKERDGQWSKEFTGGEKAIDASEQRCTANRTYGDFDITG